MLAMKLSSLLSDWLLSGLEGGAKKELTPSESLENTRPFVTVSHLPMPSYISSSICQSLSGMAMPVCGPPESPSHHLLLMASCDPMAIVSNNNNNNNNNNNDNNNNNNNDNNNNEVSGITCLI